MNKAAVYHISSLSFAYPISRNSLKIRLKAEKNDLMDAKIVYGSRYPRNEQDPYQYKDMNLVASDSLYDYFETIIKVTDNRFRYFFYLNDGQEEVWFTEKGFTERRPHGYHGFGEFFQYPIINENDLFKGAEWVQDAIFYQIFPERFYNGNRLNDHEQLEEWGEKPESDSFFGGDLEGIIKKLDYIRGLGINALYLTPIFQSSSNHKYNIDDYYAIDSNFGNKD
ncbi:MAG: alpha amylase N-terminal ig-like domain-containing protein, partial [bacterium]